MRVIATVVVIGRSQYNAVRDVHRRQMTMNIFNNHLNHLRDSDIESKNQRTYEFPNTTFKVVLEKKTPI